MNQVYLQFLRDKLQRRFEQLSNSKHHSFHNYLIMFWDFIQSPPFKSILEYLAYLYPEQETKAKSLIKNELSVSKSWSQTYKQHYSLTYFLIKKCVEFEDDRRTLYIGEIYYKYELSKPSDNTSVINAFISNVVRPVYEYIDESLEENIVISYFLVRYKHRSECFQRKNLENLYKEDTKKGEKNLCLNLYEYLFEQGIEFSIEPWSISGKADLVLAQSSDHPLIADAKIFDGDSRNISYLLKGFRQIYQYTLDYNHQPFGYLIIFKICEGDLKFEVAQNNQLVPCVVHNNKTIFFLTIDIYPHEKSASERGKLKSYIIKESDLIQGMETEEK
ncbi:MULTISPECIES: hypothetical protein [Okeania]|nr:MULTISPECIES: hypothetical protein [Okeania]NET13828.1 hypothetical protein [Okeania sp. SIO1H6]NES75557.1 hypothetical protein [Okeania sp. SIO1H4]NET17986.1 hypothetical protein [Okeania sp. SIO1H5]NET76155.1 hypothetical protein [Okeania sp. SIO1F9]NET93040.1 hypothetical protein [Okeania sp. SIO1H2]